MFACKFGLTALMISGVVPTSYALVAQPIGVTRTELQRHDLSTHGWETVQARIDIAAGGLAPKHRHPGEEVIYVLEGSLQYQVGDGPWVTYNSGDVLFIPAGTVHAARNVSKANGAELGTYIVEKGKPLLVYLE